MLDKLERKLGHLAIPHLMRYIVFGNALVYVLSLFAPGIVYYLNLMPGMVLKGQIWRIFTFIFVPSLGNPLMTAISLLCYYWIGDALERTIGSFRFGLFYVIGWVGILLVAFVLYLARIFDLGQIYNQMSYFNSTLFIALATLHPDMQILLFYVLPLKAKWAGVFSAVIIGIEFFMNSLPLKLFILASFLPYLVFFLPQVISGIKSRKRRREFEKKAGSGYSGFGGAYYTGPARENRGKASFTGAASGNQEKGSDRNVRKAAFHRCTICGITELDDPEMTFRYCSGCHGNYEYCEQHIHNHTHVE